LEIIVKEQIELLVRLQREDQALERLRRQVLEGPHRIKESESNVAALEEDLETDKRHIDEVNKAQRHFEVEVEDAVEQIRKSKGRLMAIKSNKEYQAFLKEIEDAERVNADKEDRILECMEEIEGLSQTLEVKQGDLSMARDRLEEETRIVEEDIRKAKEQIDDIERRREETVRFLDRTLLSRYERIKAKSGETAVVWVENATCSGCHMNIPPQMYNELHKGDSLEFCPHCQRIIYWKGLSDTT
jgi:predicted  nucleic acid-binding Zn-ribbon protein